jgi:hypothetical protein
MYLQVDVGEPFQQQPPGAGQVATGLQVVRKRAILVAGPGPEGAHELVLVDQAILEGDQAEEQVAIRGGGGHTESLPETGAGGGLQPPNPGGSGTGAGSVRLCHAGSAKAAPLRPVVPPFAIRDEPAWRCGAGALRVVALARSGVADRLQLGSHFAARYSPCTLIALDF